MTKCGNSGIKAAYNYKNEDYANTRRGQNVTRESIPSVLLTSLVLHATRLIFDIVVPDARCIKCGQQH